MYELKREGDKLHDLNDGGDLRSDVDVLDNLNGSRRARAHTCSAGEVCRLHGLDGDAAHLACMISKHDSVAHR